MMKRLLGMSLVCATALMGGRTASGALATYEVTFNSTWSSQTHPGAWPQGGAHFSPLIGGTHTSATRLWRDRALASPGIEAMAERGSTQPLRSEVESRIAGGKAFSVISGGGIGVSPGKVTTTFQIDSDFPLVSLVSMVAPSPDWFVGVDSLSLFECGGWRDRVVTNLVVFDSGTDDGKTFTAADIESTPHVPIHRLNDPFGGTPPVGTFEFRLVSTSDTPQPAATSFAVLGASEAGQVPEPAAALLLGTCLLALARRVRA